MAGPSRDRRDGRLRQAVSIEDDIEHPSCRGLSAWWNRSATQREVTMQGRPTLNWADPTATNPTGGCAMRDANRQRRLTTNLTRGHRDQLAAAATAYQIGTFALVVRGRPGGC